MASTVRSIPVTHRDRPPGTVSDAPRRETWGAAGHHHAGAAAGPGAAASTQPLDMASAFADTFMATLQRVVHALEDSLRWLWNTMFDIPDANADRRGGYARPEHEPNWMLTLRNRVIRVLVLAVLAYVLFLILKRVFAPTGRKRVGGGR